MKIVESVTDLIGHTPMMRLAVAGAKAHVYAKLEYLNPGGSIKDRIAWQMIEAAEKRGTIRPGDTIVEATSGNTGIGLSLVGASKGYKVVIIMPETASPERRSVIMHYGARVVLTPSADFVEGALKMARELARRPGWWMASQFENNDNVVAHMSTTGTEILEQVPSGKIGVFVAGIGTGGTLMGVGKVLKKHNPNVRIVAVEPIGSRSRCRDRITEHLKIIDHQVEGIGDGFIPQIVDTGLIDEWVQICDEDAIETACCLAREKGLFVGISSGANMFASIEIARRSNKGENIVTVFPDSADRYYTTDLFRTSCCKMGIQKIIDRSK